MLAGLEEQHRNVRIDLCDQVKQHDAFRAETGHHGEIAREVTLDHRFEHFQQGAAGIKGSFALCKKLLPMSLGYSLLAILGLLICAPLIPKIIGAEYQDSAAALMLLSPTIFFRTMHFFAADTLTGANYQNVRTIAQVSVAIINGILNFFLIPAYGWHGAIWATIASEFLLMVFLWSAIYKYSKQSA